MPVCDCKEYNLLMAISKKEVEHVARLARLGLNEEEKERMAKQLSNILDYADILKKIDTQNVPPTSYAIPMKNIFREDKVDPCLEIEELISNAPDLEAHMFRVPKIIE